MKIPIIVFLLVFSGIDVSHAGTMKTITPPKGITWDMSIRKLDSIFGQELIAIWIGSQTMVGELELPCFVSGDGLMFFSKDDKGSYVSDYFELNVHSEPQQLIDLKKRAINNVIDVGVDGVSIWRANLSTAKDNGQLLHFELHFDYRYRRELDNFLDVIESKYGAGETGESENHPMKDFLFTKSTIAGFEIEERGDYWVARDQTKLFLQVNDKSWDDESDYYILLKYVHPRYTILSGENYRIGEAEDKKKTEKQAQESDL